jgi:hypothetical protein
MVAGAAEAPLSPLAFGAFAFIRTMSRNPEQAWLVGHSTRAATVL